ncbi:14-3-3-like protein D-like [Dorcoceras hygrometricum]|uniref:14-3-3-like protein D-like n=1 Tax=Dorcoceras hygrometricum TaxID=472368 RepID=A0A2Z7CX84_9LAMI|nr:14-3-3-like protein D-like [Dorcoceras hygrometricum]
MFELPVDGLADVSEMPKDKIFDAKSIVSMTEEPVILSGLKSQMKIHYRLLCDIMAKSISVKAGSFNALTVEKFSLMTAVVCRVKMNWGRVLFGILKKMVTSGTKQAKGFAIQISLLLANVPNLELGELSEFPSSKILTEKTVHRYIAVIDKSGAQDADAAPKVTKAPKKRTTAVPADVPVVKRKRTTKKKDSSSKYNLELMAVAQEAVPIQMIEGSTAPAVDDTTDQPAAVDAFPADRPAEEIESVERVDEQLAAEPAVHVPAKEPAVEVSRVNVDDPETVIRQVLDQLDFVTEDPVVAKVDRATLSEQFNESQSGISSRLHKIEQGLRDSLREHAEVFKNLFQGARQEGRTIDDVQTLCFNEFCKNILAQNASNFTGLADVRKEVQEVNAKVDIIASRVNEVRKNVEETKEALSHQLLEFQSQAQENQNILHAQLSELVNYINRGSADKKGESSSRGPQQPPNVQNLESGQSISLEETAERIREADRRQAEMERERERQRRIRRLSGSSKRRRGY